MADILSTINAIENLDEPEGALQDGGNASNYILICGSKKLAYM